MGKRKIKITVCNVPIQLNEEVLAAYLSGYGDIEEVVKAKSAKSANGTAHGDYIFTMCLDMAIPHTLDYKSQVMTVVVEGRKPQCWNCKQLGHFSKSCPQKTTKTTTPTATTTTTTTTIAAVASATTVSSGESPNPETKDYPDKDEEGWTQVVRGGKKKETFPPKLPTTTTVPKPTTATTVTTVTPATTSTAKSSATATAKKNKEKIK